MRRYQLDVVVTRGESIESRHRVHAAVVDPSDNVVGSAGDIGLPAPWRSCAKPFQVMPLVESGGFEELAWGEDQLALACASHGGEPEHVAIAEGMLNDLGLEEGDLACGPHEPLSSRGSRILRDVSSRPTRLHNNCSGKHAAMLARARLAGWSMTGYEREGHPVQEGALAKVSQWAGVPANRIQRAIDGCGVVVFGLPLENMARAYSRFACAARGGDEVPSRIATSMGSRGYLIGGTDRFDTIVIEETAGRVIAKIGSEGLHSVAVMDQGLGLAVKVEDGAVRAQYPAVLRLLQHLGALPDPLPARLQEYMRVRVKNTRGEFVGEVRMVDG